MQKNLIAIAMAVAVLMTCGAGTDFEKAFDDAFKAGEPLKAENAFKALVAAKPDTAPVRYFQAAEVARQMGRETLRRDRLAHYLRVEKGWNASVEEAAWYMCANGGSFEQLARLAKSAPASNALYELGRDLLFRARDAKRGVEALGIADVLLEKFASDSHRREVMGVIVRMKCDGAPGVDAERVRELILKYPFKDMGEYRDWTFLWMIQRQRDDYSAAFRLQWCKKLGAALPPVLFGSVDMFDPNSKRETDIAYCKRLATLFKEVEPLVLKPGNGEQACSLLYNEIRLSGFYFKASQANEQAAAYYDLLLKTIACYEKGKVNCGEMRRRTREMWDRKLLAGKVDYWQKLRDGHPEVLDDDILISWGPLRSVAEKAKNVSNIKAFISKNPSRAWEARRRTRDLWAQFGDAKQVMDDLEAEFVWCAADKVDGVSTLNTLRALKVKDTEKIAFLRRIYGRIGAHDFFNWIKRDANVRASYSMFKTPEGEAFVKEIDEKKPAGDRLVRHMKELFRMGRENGNLCPARAHEIMTAVFADYKADYPQDNRPENGSINRMLDKYFDLCRHNMRSSEKFAETLLKGYGRQNKANWNYLREVQWNLREKGGLYYAVLDRRAEVTGNANLWDCYRFSVGTDKLPASADLEKMDLWHLYTLMRENVGFAFNNGREKVRFSDALKAKVVATTFRRYNVPKWDAGHAGELLLWLGSAATNRALMAQFPYDKVAGETLDYGKGWSPSFAPRFIEFAAKTGRHEAARKRFFASLDQCEPSARVRPLVVLLGNWYAAPWTEKKEDSWGDLYGEILAKRFLPTLKAVPDAKASLAYFIGNGPDWWSRYNRYFEIDLRKNDKAARQLRQEINCELSRLWCHGLRGVPGDWGVRVTLNNSAYQRALSTTNVVGLVAVADAVGREAGALRHTEMLDLINRTRAIRAWEPLFLLVNAIPGNVNGEVVALATRCRAEAATKLPGVYPVGEKDPAYPLYVAADELARKNTEGALKLFNRNVAVFERELLKLPPDFVAWGVDQLRLQRGKKDELLLKARKLATSVVSAESKVTPELVAAMILVRAESFRDQQNFEAAKLEYQSIRDNPAYHKTPSGRKAMFRAIDLQIESGQGSQAEQTLEYWLSQPDPEVQAEAHYFLARIAFDRKDYEECIKQLKEVFAINLTHTEARFLQGKWKLATNSEVDETDVWIGQLSDRTAIRPGQQLSITVQDRNLSVAGGGSSIPVIVRTDRGRDLERIFLYPSARDANLFKGLIDVRLGAAAPSNTVLEVRGDDTATYAIDPEFLKARGLPLGDPKRLRVVDDARLAVGAGKPRTEEDDAARIEAMVSDEKGADTKTLEAVLRPGNPLYIAVSDKDRSCGGEADTVDVSVSTTSGDRLSKVTLAEVRPFSGVFRGVVPTALPPPRAFASDTAAGFNPGDAINSTRDGLWRSLADGQPVKWFAVDTMGSHVVSEVTVSMVAPEEITALSLTGELGGEKISLATLPASDPKEKVGLRLQTDRAGGFRGETQMREFMTRAEAPKATPVKDFTYRPQWNDKPNIARFSGAFLLPAGFDYLRLRLEPLSSATDALRSLAVTAALDGKTFFSGRGFDLQNATFLADVTPGVHFLEIFATAWSTENDAFRILWEPLGEEPRELPMDWFDAAKHKEVLDFVADKAVIRRTADGFTAKFVQPVRLRTLRWEFTGRRSPDVVIRKISATDTDGKTFLPVKSDFSDAQSNDTLEVAPGDKIVVQYADEVTASGSKRILERGVGSQFTDGRIALAFEESVPGGADGVPRLSYHEAYRFTPGDTLAVTLDDADLDVSDKADSVEVTVKSGLGGLHKMLLVEQTPADDRWKPEDGIHTRRFLGLVKTIGAGAEMPTNRTDGLSSKITLRTREDDVLTVSYVDRENTRPGVPCSRTASVLATKPTTPRLTLFHTRQTRVVDNSEEAKLKLASIRKRAGNEKVEKVFRDTVFAVPMTQKASSDTNAIPMNIAAPILVRINDPSRARHSDSRLTLEAVTERELLRAETEGDEPEIAQATMTIGGGFGPVHLKSGGETERTALRAGSFNGFIHLAIGSLDNLGEDVLKSLRSRGRDMPLNALAVYGNDIVHLRVLDGEEVLVERTLSFVSNGSLALMDSSWSAERDTVHVGERLFVQVRDADRDVTDEADRITVDVKSALTGRSRKVVLTETVPHSGVFNGVVRPCLFPKGEQIPACVTGGVDRIDELVSEDRFAANYGDRLTFSYRDEVVLPGSDPRTLCATGGIYRGSDGSVRLFSKRFRDSDQAVLVQFRLAECLFEQAKDFRKLKQTEKSSEAIARGRFILEEALKNYPDSAHVMQGEFLLANLFQELAAEQREAKNEEKARQLFTDALSRFSTLVAAWPEGEYAARAQYHKAYCLEMLADYRRAAEEYVKMTYLYPESELIGDATIRLATHYYTREHRYEVSARIYENFQRRFPQHAKAARALFMCGSCYIKQAETSVKEAEAKAAGLKKDKAEGELRKGRATASAMYAKAAEAFERIGEVYRETAAPELRAQALYWAGDAYLRGGNAKQAYRSLKRCVLDFPETEWARRARGLLLQESESFSDMEG